MLRLIVRRLLESIPMLLALSFLTFYLLFHSPGDHLSALKMNPQISPETLAREAERLGLDRPFYVVWWRWVQGVVFHGDLGQSFYYKIPAAELIRQRMFATFLLAFSATLFAWMIGVPLGILAATRHNRFADRVASGIAFFGLSIPSILLALFAVYLAANTGWFPTSGMRSDTAWQLTSPWDRMVDIMKHMVLPTVVLGMGGLAIYTRHMRSNLLECMQADYVRTARSKGVTGRTAILKHALRNAINPLITLFGFAFADLLSGSVIVENVLAWPGLGRLVVESYFNKDMFVVASSVIMGAAMLIIGNLIADILLAIADPRIRHD